MKKIKCTALIVLVFCLFNASKTYAQAIDLYGFSLTLQKSSITIIVFTTNPYPGTNPHHEIHSIVPGQVMNLRDYTLDGKNLNDVANQAVFTAKAGTRIIFYNNADADYSRGRCELYVKQDVGGYFLTSLEHTYEDAYIKVNWYSEGQNSLNGNLSSVVFYK